MQVLVTEATPVVGEKGFGSAAARVARQAVVVTREQLADNLSSLCEEVHFALQKAAAALKAYELEQVEVTTEFTAKGELCLVGGLAAEAKGGLKLTFKHIRKPE